MSRTSTIAHALLSLFVISTAAAGQMKAGRADDGPTPKPDPRARIQQTCAKQSRDQQALQSCLCELGHDASACKQVAEIAKSARDAATRKRLEEMHQQEVRRRIADAATSHNWYYAGPGAAAVRYLLSAAPGWQLSSCAECRDMVLPEIRVSTSSTRDTYVGEALMHAWAAENYASLGQRDKAAEEGAKVLEAVKSTNSLCSDAPAWGFGDPNQPPERTTEDVWPCPTPDLSYMAMLHVSPSRQATANVRDDAAATALPSPSSASAESDSRLRARIKSLAGRTTRADTASEDGVDATAPTRNGDSPDENKPKSFLKELLGDTEYNQGLAQGTQAQKTLNIAMRTKSCATARQAVELHTSAISHYQAVTEQRQSLAAQQIMLLENTKRIAERQVELTCR